MNSLDGVFSRLDLGGLLSCPGGALPATGLFFHFKLLSLNVLQLLKRIEKCQIIQCTRRAQERRDKMLIV